MNGAPRKQPPPKKAYARPTLIEYGSLKDIVQGSTGSMSDGSAGNTKGCWIAEALYGEHDPRTFLLRSWMAGIYDARHSGWPLVAFYRRSGPVLAPAIHATPFLRRSFRVIFDALLIKAFRNLVIVAKITKTR